MRGSLIRVVSARNMNRKKRSIYAKAQARPQANPEL
jgi:uncharacterized DUF497 family protein